MEDALHLIIDVRGGGQLVAQVDEGYRHLQLLLLQKGEEELLVEAIGFTYLALDTVAFDGPFEPSFRNAYQYGGIAWLLCYGEVNHP